ncbi:FMN-binding negative transcriptional regulator [Maribacter polysiphoniae]|uniref:FMN-binding negative transcriptional regulator n=1 Tax=Maribacter polysiphoniae TaxID=429344 RepID=A0A316DZ56_9FLAO|nr:FMN-binding negative transcriptional regulator [Maribacter polysiphoniae]MBD1261082.1 FMN-binding negative transcriptional regulator [Maribacter polysiphoniae]PWK23677.1 PaiB family negative transcriptional regulator [Maribacter polysiphoniae]
MYIPHQYKNGNIAEVKDFLAKNSFGILVNQVDGKPWATHIPLELDTTDDGKDVLVSHISKANPQWKHFEENDNVLCIFNGPHSYISSSWYKEEEVPTWNYIAVHVYGKIKILTEEEVMASMHKLVDKYEEHSENPISLDHLSEKTLRQVKGVVGFQITIDSIQAAYKLSQGREHDHERIIEALENTKNPNSKDIAKRMKG